MKRLIFTAGLLILGIATARAQFPLQNQPQWLNYESESFFFRPAYYTSDQSGSFNHLGAGWGQERLDKMAVNAALTGVNPNNRNQVYLDVNSRHEYSKWPFYYNVPARSSTGFLPGRNFEGQSSVMEPFISAAWLSSPMLDDRLSIGVTYQNLYFDGPYYRADTDILHMAESSIALPLGELSESDMRQVGHFGRVSVSYKLSRRFSVGAQFGKTWFNRDGQDAAYEIYSFAIPDNSSPLESMVPGKIQRHQQYDHWDVNTGLAYVDEDRGLQLSLKAGFLEGGGVQQQGYDYSRSIQEGRVDVTETWNLYSNNTLQYLDWNEQGETWYAGLDGQKVFATEHSIRFGLDGYFQTTDLMTLGRYSKAYFSNRQYWMGSELRYTESGRSIQEIREGSGAHDEQSYRGYLYGEIALGANAHMNIGVRLSLRNSWVEGREQVEYSSRDDQLSGSRQEGQTNELFVRRKESKQLVWHRDTDYRTVRIPIVFSKKLWKSLNLRAGMLYAMYTLDDQWKGEARYNYRETESLEYGVERREDFKDLLEGNPTRFRDTSTAILMGVEWRLLNRVVLKSTILPLYSQPQQFDNDGKLRWQAGLKLEL